MRKMKWLMGLTGAAVFATGANAAYLIEVDTDGADDAVLTFNADFAFGGDTTTASQSAASPALGMTGGDSIFGGNGSAELDTYTFAYTPGTDADNLALTAGDVLGAGLLASGIVGGGTDNYTIYATWPFTTNVSGGLTTFELWDLDSNTQVWSTSIDQNDKGDEWVRLGVAAMTSGTNYELRQIAGSNSFVSMRSAGVLFEIPEPGTFALVGLGGLSLLSRRRTA